MDAGVSGLFHGLPGPVHILAAAASQGGNHRPTEVVLWSSGAITADKPEHFFLERYRAAYAAEMAHFFDVVAGRARARTSIDDGVMALELAEAATTSWREKRIVTI